MMSVSAEVRDVGLTFWPRCGTHDLALSKNSFAVLPSSLPRGGTPVNGSYYFVLGTPPICLKLP